MRTSSRALIVGLALAFGASAGCSGPYSNKAERLKKPPTKKMPEQVEEAAPEIKWAMECSVKFQEDATKAMAQHNKGMRRAGELQRDGVSLLEKAAAAPDTEHEQIAGLTKEGIGKLRSALLEDPYHAEATYYLAVGYARSRRKACALALLKRLTELVRYEDFTSAARRMIKQGEDDPAFSLFRKEANEAMGL